MKKNNTTDAFFALLRAGLWEKDVLLSPFGEIDYSQIFQLSQEQAVVGLIAAGLENVKDVKVPQAFALQFVGQTLQIEQRNKSMNSFIGDVVERMQEKGIYTLLVKGQGIAQCYERPLWRSSGDVDFFLSNNNYKKAKQFLLPLSTGNKPERLYSKEMGLNIDKWYVEVHGTLRTGLSTRVDNVIDSVQDDVFYGGDVCSWTNGNIQVFLPAANSNVFFVFTHFIKHFYKEGGVSIRQLCDLCRLIWSFKEKGKGTIDIDLLENRLNRAGLLREWKGFAAIAVDYLGMPVEAMPLYCSDKEWKVRAKKIVAFILKGGKWQKVKDTIAVSKIYPFNTLRFLPGILLSVNWLKIKERLLKD